MAGDLRQRFFRLWSQLAAQTPPETVFSALLSAYSDPRRAYHNVTHLCHCLEELDATRSLAEHPDEVEVALWFHDAVYEPLAKDSEARSAAMAGQELRAAGVARESVERVMALIMATKHAQTPATQDAQLIGDIDLAILGQPAARFDDYEENIQREYAMVPEAQFRQGRAAILESFLRRPTIYHTDHFHQKYEAVARGNLQRSIRVLHSQEGQH